MLIHDHVGIGTLTEVRNVAQNQQGLQDCKSILNIRFEWDINKRAAVEREKIVKERKEIFDWLSPPNFFARHADIFETRQKGTGLWFLRERKFQDWLSLGGTLWCHGIRMFFGTLIFFCFANDTMHSWSWENSTYVCSSFIHSARCSNHFHEIY
jgi:hypothetical protein